MGFSRQEYWNGLPFPSPGDLPRPGIEPGSPAQENTSVFSASMSLSLPCRWAHQCHLSRFHIHALIYDICHSLSDLPHSVGQALAPGFWFVVQAQVLSPRPNLCSAATSLPRDRASTENPGLLTDGHVSCNVSRSKTAHAFLFFLIWLWARRPAGRLRSSIPSTSPPSPMQGPSHSVSEKAQRGHLLPKSPRLLTADSQQGLRSTSLRGVTTSCLYICLLMSLLVCVHPFWQENNVLFFII